MTVDMNFRSGGRVPAGVSGQAGRGAVGTVAPAGRLSPMVRAAAAGYALAGVILAGAAFVLAPWGLLLLVLAVGSLLAAALCAFVAAGISELEGDPT